MNWRILKPNDPIVFVDHLTKLHDSILLGAEHEYFWIFVTDLKMVYQGHPDRITEENRKMYFKIHDRQMRADRVIDEVSNGSPSIFYCSSDSSNADRMIKLLKTYMLILPPSEA